MAVYYVCVVRTQDSPVRFNIYYYWQNCTERVEVVVLSVLNVLRGEGGRITY